MCECVFDVYACREAGDMWQLNLRLELKLEPTSSRIQHELANESEDTDKAVVIHLG